MECFAHEGRPAVGTCRACGKGVCRSCAADLGRGLACSGRCEEPARALIASIEQSIRIQGLSGGMVHAARTLWVGIAWVSLAVGVFVVLFGLSLPRFREIALLGIPFLGIGLLTLRVARRARRAGEAGVSSSPA
jgi:hypothetical protein